MSAAAPGEPKESKARQNNSRWDERTQRVTFYVPRQLITRLREATSTNPHSADGRPTRSQVLVAALEQYLDGMEER